LKIPDVRLVSFTVDPANDTPPVLAAYAKMHGASPSMWYFLTGPVATLQMLDRDAFKLGDIDATLQHSTRFVLVDGQGRIRGYYDTSESSAIPKVISDIDALAAGTHADGRPLASGGERHAERHRGGVARDRLHADSQEAHRGAQTRDAHAFSVSVVFLACYLIYHASTPASCITRRPAGCAIPT
jgi:hypothetical protein